MINLAANANLGIVALPLITFLTLLLLFVLGIAVGYARGKYQVPVPQTSGNDTFERVFRVHQNTIEQTVGFLPGLWLFGLTVNANVAAILGIIWIIGRILYAWGYYLEAKKRAPGFALSMLANLTLLFGGGYGAIKLAIQAVSLGT
ncbi:MAG: MAPEG family protein [Pseudanabaenaceae cyanobacterium bins.68]|nr:MAPEG family protein [Pseudanabaenaceae cyanobacterium bins.68]